MVGSLIHAGPLRVGLIGYGVAGRVFHAPLIAADRDFRLDVVVTADPTRTAAAAAAHPGARVVRTADEMFAGADDLDVVVVASPTPTHFSLAMAALRAGLAVVVDKPFAVTSAQGEELLATAEANHVLLQIFQNRRWDGDFATVRQLLASGELGTVHRFESRFEWWKPAIGASWKDTATSTEGAGMAYDLGTHLIDQAITLFGPVAQAWAELDARRPGAVNDDDSFIALQHVGGVRSHLWMSSLAAVPGPRFRVFGSAGTFTKYGLDPQEDALAAGMSPADPGYGREPADRFGVLGTGGSSRVVPTLPGSYADFYRQFADALLRGGVPPVDSKQPLDVLRLLEKLVAG